MSSVKYSNIKLLQSLFLENKLLTAKYLNSKGISFQLQYKYVKNGWLEKIYKGAYKAPGSTITWEMAIEALQKQLDLNVHVGAKTTFFLKGKSHYLGKVRVYLFCFLNVNIPKWFYKLKCFESLDLLVYHGNPILDWNIGFSKFNNIKISSLERAAIELVAMVERNEGFDETSKLFEGLTNLRSKLLMQLLKSTKSVKAKRLFLYFAEKSNFSWFKKLDISKIDLGSGPRQIVKTGKYNNKYKIMIPEDVNNGN